jgi:hypothetical protein
MSDIFESQAFQEFLQKRCEEIITEDEECLKVIDETRIIGKEFFNSLSTDQQKAYLEFESSAEKRNTQCATTLYKRAMRDRIFT